MCGRQETVVQTMTCLEKEMFFNAVEMPPIQVRFISVLKSQFCFMGSALELVLF
jgi:hypothetical protein